MQPEILGYDFVRMQSARSYAEEVEFWTPKITRIWQPDSVCDIRPRSGGIGFLFIANLPTELVLHLGVSHGSVDLCALWQDDMCVLWDSLIGFCSSWPTLTLIQQREDAEDFAMRTKPIVRRNCFLLGAKVESTETEQRQWEQWLCEQASS